MIEFIQRRHIMRHWPFLVAVAAWLMLFFPPFFQSEIVRAAVAVGCMVLMLVQWLIYRKATRGTDFFFLSFVVAGFGLANLWLALNVIRFYTYDAEQGSGIHILIVRTQGALVWIIAALVAVISVWSLFAVVRWVGKRMAAVAR